jgi:ABC-type uncharacterized transport system ATPase subunit
MTPVLELRNITKRFPSVLANDQISLTLEKGEIHALLGENGAGKTTLMNILYGLYQPDEGRVFVNGNQVNVHSPGDAIAAGIGMVHQHFMLVPVFTVTENVMLGNETINQRSKWPMGILAIGFGLLYSILVFLLNPQILGAIFNPIKYGISSSFHNILILFALLLLLSGPIAVGLYIGLNYLLGGFLNRISSAERIRKISTQYGLTVDPDTYIKDLPVGIQQRVEIIKLLYRNAEILIFDEPTAVLTPQESDELFKIMRSLTKQGKSIIFITHKLREVLDCADRITVLRRGKVVGTTTPKEANQPKLASMMVGRPVMLEVEKGAAKPGDVVLEAQNLVVTNDRRQVSVEDVSFDVRKGEVLGIAGVQGNGQTELVEALTGLRQVTAGSFLVNGKIFGKDQKFSWLKNSLQILIPVIIALAGLFFLWLAFFAKTAPLFTFFIRLLGLKTPMFSIYEANRLSLLYHIQFYISLILMAASVAGFILLGSQASGKTTPRKIIELGTAHIPEDRQRDGLVLPSPVSENLVLCTYYQQPFSKGVTIQWPIVRENAARLVSQFDIRTPGTETLVSHLSGGNQQKVIVARELSRPIDLLIAAQPTRGLDVGSIEYIHGQIIKKRDEGVAVLVVSTELDEIMQLSDRIAVMYRGKILATVPANKATKELIGLLMAGIPLEQAEEQIAHHSNKHS